MTERISIIEDDPDIVEMVGYNLRREGFAFDSFGSGKVGFQAVRDNPPDLLLLDVLLPDESGFEVCRRIRALDRLRAMPVLFLTARGEEVDRILGLELGADDYVVKPFSPRELVARVRVALRRRRPAPSETVEVIAVRDLRIDSRTYDVSVGGKPVQLSALEFRLLFYLASHPKQVFSRGRLLDEVWGEARSVTERTVDVHIRRLREKIERQPDSPEYIGTVRGAGYRFVAGQNLPE